MIEMVKIVQTFVAVLAWPFVWLATLGAFIRYRKDVLGLLQGAKVKLEIFNFGIETSIPVIEQSVKESLGGRKLTAEQLALLRKLRDEGRVKFDSTQLDVARPLRNCGLIRNYPEGKFLAEATEIELTILGDLLAKKI